MLLASGADTPLLDRVCKQVESRVVDELSFELALENRATTLLCVDPLHRAGAAPPAPGSLAGARSAAEAPSVSRVIVVTHRVDGDGDLRRLRQSGARYVIARAPQVIDADALGGRSLLVPRDLETTPLITLDDLAVQVLGLLANGDLMGQTIELTPTPRETLALLATKPKVVPRWRAKLGRWLKQPVLEAAA